MEFKNLEGLSERTLKFMIVDLYSQNDKLKKQIKECEKPLLEKISELNMKKDSLDYEILYYKSIIDTFDKSDVKIIGQWLEQNCEPAQNVLAEDGKTHRAPTSFRLLYDNFGEWCVENINLKVQEIPDMQIVKKELKKWQEKSQFGLTYGKRKDQAGVNGYEANMLFNLKII